MQLLDLLVRKTTGVSQRIPAHAEGHDDGERTLPQAAQAAVPSVPKPSSQSSPFEQLYTTPVRRRPLAQSSTRLSEPSDSLAPAPQAPSASTPETASRPDPSLPESPALVDLQNPEISVATTESAAGDRTAYSGPPEEARIGLKDCRSRACAGVVDTFKLAMRRTSPLSVGPTADSAPTSTSSPSSTLVTSSSDDGDRATGSSDNSNSSSPAGGSEDAAPGSDPEDRCPPDTWQLGRATWTFLHSVAAHYPDRPSERQQALMQGLLDGLVEFYPCEICAEHLREQVKDNPPRVATAQDLNLWLCGIHNEVNEMLGKPLFDCSRITERWREGPADGSCD